MTQRQTVVSIVAAIVVGWWLGSSPASPVNPHPVQDRPVLRAIGKLTRTAARLGLWFALAAEPPPHVEDRQQLVRAPRVDDEGHRVIDHGEGW
jgi:alkanesulfonate monooxygenase SsuD/methylene tetrahydromethanopterin reductase-like flavin-dependent oxidoreductase (luciferase family)